ncbi:endonuclease/exonuclease/phosphatase family protein [Cellulomonas cellasea]|uniref:Endonuclease/exonuclease/phosphatase family metal-dependent hydrolase n=1 Tax=Cellulomonas cellasea TaxID=43670 RepID=A0A7W4UDW6_9CELL|nr:endonuclease/exonuclease/phosphatase family protein [Cellulomonas cellasea]MBB2922396.1 endonuclease/exonuclease/phosphatase family metal-dependent hydrolase [Cellulomonas cellasea]
MPVLRVMTYNLKGLKLDAAAAAAVVRAADPDVVGVQEPPRGPLGRWRLRRFARDAGLRVAVGHGGARTTALLVSPRAARVEDARAVRLPWFGPRERRTAWTRRGYALATVDGVRVVSVHLSLDRLERARHLSRILAEVEATPGPCVVVGDLNEQPGGETWGRLGTLLRDAHVAAVHDDAREALGVEGAAGRASGGSPAEPARTFSAVRPRRRIDAVLASPDLVPRGARVPDDDVARRASDHLPIVAELELPG